MDIHLREGSASELVRSMFTLFALLIVSPTVTTGATWIVEDDTLEYVDARLVVRFDQSHSNQFADSVLDLHDCQFIRFLPDLPWAICTFDTVQNVDDVLENLVGDVSIVAATPELYVEFAGTQSPPNDSLFDDQWNLYNTGQLGGKPGADISAFKAWSINTGRPGIKIAILDSGVPLSRQDHPCDTLGELSWPDLQESYRVSLEANLHSGEEGCFPNDWSGGHGTGVASIIAADINNTFGMCGVVDSVEIMVLKIYSGGWGTKARASAIIEGIAEAIELDPDVINASWGVNLVPGAESFNDLYEEGVSKKTFDAGIILVAAAHNYPDLFVAIPAAHSQWGTLEGHANGYSNIIGVSGTDRWDSLFYQVEVYPNDDTLRVGNCKSNESFRTWVSAPAESVLMAWSRYDPVVDSTETFFTYWRGTSFATPQVVGLAGLLLSQNDDLSPDSVRQIIKNSADKVWLDTSDTNIFVPFSEANGEFWEGEYRSWHPEYGFGRINCYHALLSQVWDGDIDSNTTWAYDADDPERILWGDLVIDSGKTLIIDSGTVVKAVLDTDNQGVSSGRCEIIVKGTLIVKGTANHPVKFTSKLGYEDKFYGIRVVGGGKVKLDYAVIENAYSGVTLAGSASDTLINCQIGGCEIYGIRVENDNAVIEDCMISNIDPGYGIYVYQSDPAIEDDSIWACETGIYSTAGSDPTIDNVKIIGPGTYGASLGNGGDTLTVVSVDNLVVKGTFAVANLTLGSSGRFEINYANLVSDTGGRSPSIVSVGLPTKFKLRHSNIAEYGDQAFGIAYCDGRKWDLGKGRSASDMGYNNIYSSDTGATYFNYSGEISGGDIMAQYNYWGASPPPAYKFLTSGTYSVNYGNYASSPYSKLALEERTEVSPVLPSSFSLDQNHPNPFNPSTMISYAIPIRGHVQLSIYNILGQKVRLLVDQEQQPGFHQSLWDGRDQTGREVASGIYLYRLDVANLFQQTKKMIMMK